MIEERIWTLKDIMKCIQPYHITSLKNLRNILKYKKILSKNILTKNKISFEDLGNLEEQQFDFDIETGKIGSELIIFSNIYITRQYNGIKFEMTYNPKILDLKDFVRLYIFIFHRFGHPIFPKFVYEKIMNEDSILMLKFINLLSLVNELENRNIEYYILYGHPSRKNPKVFKTLEDFINYLAIDLPCIDAMREWLKVDKKCGKIYSPLEFDRGYFETYTDKSKRLKPDLAHFLSSELIVRDELSVSAINRIFVISNDESLKEDVVEICRKNQINLKVDFLNITKLRNALKGVR